jgi:2-amino-4-hydroxy-6-hydroxymethyldihydropteridine diphosphokinase
VPDAAGRAAAPARRRAFLALGSNLGDRAATLRSAVAALVELGDLEAVSDVFETAPVGGPDDQGPYLNLVVRLSTRRSARELLEVSHRLEQAAHRVRLVRWGPRTLDVDVLWVDGERVDEPDLEVPHPRLFERAFVLAPLEDVGPDVVPPGWRATIDAGDVVRLGPLDALPG